MDWLDLLAVKGTLKSLLQHHSSKASILQSSTFFIVHLSYPYMITGKTIMLYILETILILVFISQVTVKSIYLIDDVVETLSRIQVTLYKIINWMDKSLAMKDKAMKLKKKLEDNILVNLGITS